MDSMPLQWMLLFISILGSWPSKADEVFKFTQDQYTATVPENTVGKAYIVPNSPMGIRLVNPSWSVKYRFIESSDSKIFRLEPHPVGDFCFLRIRPKTGRSESLNREQQDKYRVTVKAVLENDPLDRVAITEIVISVLDANDLNPLFEQNDYAVDVAEDHATHSSVLRVYASDADVGVNSEVYYSMRQKLDMFSIHPTTGVISLMKKLSYSENSKYEFEVLAQDRGPVLGPVPRLSSAMVHINVIEVNSFAPDISIQRPPAVIDHGKVGTVYAILYIRDKNYGSNGEIDTVEIVSGDADRYFQVVSIMQSHEYRVQVAKHIDRSVTAGKFNLTIMAKDKGRPPRNTTVTIPLKLWEVNFPPEFEKRFYNITADECLPVGYSLLMLKVRDRGNGLNSLVEYTIVAGNDLGWLFINPRSGIVSIASRLDADNVKELTVTIVAEDQAANGVRRRTQAVLQVILLDCNDNAPVFKNIPLDDIAVEESSPVGSLVYQVTARDIDKGDNGYVSFSIVNGDSIPFAIDHFNGKITITQPLDYELKKRSFKLRIRASDWGEPFRRESEAILKVKITDVNDNVPEFERLDCVGFFSREAPPGSELVVMSAIDLDMGNIVSYRIESGNEDNCFEIVVSAGLLRSKCDFHKQGSAAGYSIVVIASDGLHDSSPTTLNITLLASSRHPQLSMQNSKITCRDNDIDVKLSAMLKISADVNKADESFDLNVAQPSNTDEPVFAANVLRQLHVTEGVTKPGEKIGELVATDADYGYGGFVTYVIASGDEMGTFHIDPYKGDLYIAGELDREQRDHYLLNITVADMGQPPKYASTILEIDVDDINDNAPEFEKSSYAAYIPEDAPVNNTVILVTAFDKDLGLNAEIQYSLEGDTRAFRIDPRTGMILVNGLLDRESISSYDIVIKATDRSLVNPLSSSVNLKINLIDVNDNPPQFQSDYFVIHVPEDIPVNSVLLTVTAVDPDESPSAVRYNLSTDSDTDLFEIDRITGAIRLIAALDYETRRVFNLTVKVRDRSISSMSSSCLVTIHVTDVNENFYAPVFQEFVYLLNVGEDLPTGTLVGHVMAEDNDKHNLRAMENDYKITYSIRGGTGLGLFYINSDGLYCNYCYFF